MSSDADAKTRAADLVEQIVAEQSDAAGGGPDQVSPAQVASLVDALAVDMVAADHAPFHDVSHAEERLLKVEAQTRALSDAVVAIAEPSEAIAPAVQAVKDEM